MSSSRLPGKVLMPVLGRPLLGYLTESLQRVSGADHLIVATSVDPSDDPIAAFCRSEGISCWRGPLDDVAARFSGAIREFGLDAFVRVCGDCPLLDFRLVEQAIRLFREGSYEVVTCALERSFPQGQVVEVVSAEAFQRQVALFEDDADREHVTRRLYLARDRFVIHNFLAPVNLLGTRMVVDTEEDFRRVEALLSRLDKPHWEYDYQALASLAGGVSV